MKRKPFIQDGSELIIVRLPKHEKFTLKAGYGVQDSTCGYYRRNCPLSSDAAWVRYAASAARFPNKGGANELARQTAEGRYDAKAITAATKGTIGQAPMDKLPISPSRTITFTDAQKRGHDPLEHEEDAA